MIMSSVGCIASPCSTPQQLERVLNSQEVIRAMPPGVRRHALEKLTELKRTLRQTTCSEPWFNECWPTGMAFPPKAATSPMLGCRCERCIRQGRVWPAFYGAPADPCRAPADGGRRNHRCRPAEAEHHLV